MSSKKVPLSTPRFILSSDGDPSVGKRFCKQSAEHPTTLNQFFVLSRASLVGFIYFEKSMFLMSYLLSTDEVQKSTVLLSEILADKAWSHSYSPTQTAFNKYSGYPDPLFIYYEKVNAFDILFSSWTDRR